MISCGNLPRNTWQQSRSSVCYLMEKTHVCEYTICETTFNGPIMTSIRRSGSQRWAKFNLNFLRDSLRGRVTERKKAREREMEKKWTVSELSVYEVYWVTWSDFFQRLGLVKIRRPVRIWKFRSLVVGCIQKSTIAGRSDPNDEWSFVRGQIQTSSGCVSNFSHSLEDKWAQASSTLPNLIPMSRKIVSRSTPGYQKKMIRTCK